MTRPLPFDLTRSVENASEFLFEASKVCRGLLIWFFITACRSFLWLAGKTRYSNPVFVARGFPAAGSLIQFILKERHFLLRRVYPYTLDLFAVNMISLGWRSDLYLKREGRA